MNNSIPVASAHGRFQPLHKDHLEYLLAAKEDCDFLWVGITQFNVRALSESPLARHRELRANNPLTYFERVELITEALLDEGIQRNEFGITPFPIESPDALPDFLPTTIPIFTTICDDWNRYKIRLLREKGYQVIVLWERTEQALTGMQVREKIREGDPQWRDYVPPATVRAVERYQLSERLKLSVRASW